MSRHVASGQDSARLEAVIQSYVPEQFMGSVLVAQGGTLVLHKAYGSANLERNIPHTVDSRFRIGSLTKQFTAAAILLLEEQGKLKTSDRVSAHLRDTPEAWQDITLHHLLSHTAGLRNVTDLPTYAASMSLSTTVADTLRSVRELPLDFVPGNEFRYSNSGYLLLGHLLEVITGDTYAAFVHDRIFVPLGMTSSGYDCATELQANRACGYLPGPNGPTSAPYIAVNIAHAAGALSSTTADLRRWSQGLFGGELLSTAALEKMTTPGLGDYGYGLYIMTNAGGKRIAHDGNINGFNSALTWYPDEQLLLVALSNIDGTGAVNIAAYLDKVMHGETFLLPEERQPLAVSTDILSRYVGTYELTPEFIAVMTLEDGQLMTQATGLSKVPMYAETETRFFLKVIEASIEFRKDAAGLVTGLVLEQNGRAIPGIKR